MEKADDMAGIQQSIQQKLTTLDRNIISITKTLKKEEEQK
jgi:hypothetical protein